MWELRQTMTKLVAVRLESLYTHINFHLQCQAVLTSVIRTAIWIGTKKEKEEEEEEEEEEKKNKKKMKKEEVKKHEERKPTRCNN